MALVYTDPTALSQFNFVHFKNSMGISDMDETAFVLIIRAIFDNLLTQYEIDIDTLNSITYDFTLAVYRHAKFLHEVQKQNLDVIAKTSDASGNRTTFKVEVPKDISATYKMYSPVAPALL